MQAELDFVLGTMPIDDVDLTCGATLENGVAKVYDLSGGDNGGEGKTAVLRMNTSTWSAKNTLLLKVRRIRFRSGRSIHRSSMH